MIEARCRPTRRRAVGTNEVRVAGISVGIAANDRACVKRRPRVDREAIYKRGESDVRTNETVTLHTPDALLKIAKVAGLRKVALDLLHLRHVHLPRKPGR